MANIQCEVTPLNNKDLFILLNNLRANCEYPVHFHSDYELNLVMNTSGKRIIGDSIEQFQDEDLVLIGPRVPHAWRAVTNDDTHVITIQFDEQIYDSFLINKRIFEPIKECLERSNRGIVFTGDTRARIKRKILDLSRSRGFSSALSFYDILNDLATAQEQYLLTSASYDSSSVARESKSRRIEKICNYIEANFNDNISLDDIAVIVNMSKSAVSHFFKKRTNRTYITYLTDIRIGNAARMLAETTHSINEIAYECGFSSLSNFNRTFKKYKNQTPSDYRTDAFNTMTKF